MVLYINACVRAESRTDELARVLLSRLGEPFVERKLADEPLAPLSRERLAYRTQRSAEGDFSDPMFAYAKEFASADTIVMAAPYWDLSFPALLREYIEAIYVVGIVSRYSAEGARIGLCRAKRLYYVTTAGGAYDPRFSYDYIRELSMQYFGIPETRLVKAELLDIAGNDPAAILRKAKEQCAAAE